MRVAARQASPKKQPRGFLGWETPAKYALRYSQEWSRQSASSRSPSRQAGDISFRVRGEESEEGSGGGGKGGADAGSHGAPAPDEEGSGESGQGGEGGPLPRPGLACGAQHYDVEEFKAKDIYGGAGDGSKKVFGALGV